MNLYLDDDSTKKSLAMLLRKTGHRIVIPAEVGFRGRSDTRQMQYAVTHGLVLLSRNYDDFIELHDLIVASGGRHSGIILVREDNDRKRDMTDQQIIAAIGRLENSELPIADNVIVLNQWR